MKKTRFLLAFCLLFASSCFAQKEGYGTYYNQRVTLFEKLPITSSDMIFLGNSISDGCEWNELFENPHIRNRGISGDVVMGVYDRLDPVLKGRPAKIFLMIGINDVSHDLTADSILTMIKMVVNRIKVEAPKTKLYIQSILPVNDAFTRFPKIHNKSQVIVDINKGLAILAQENNCTYVDLYPYFIAPGTQHLDKKYTNDGLHLLGEGYLLWKEVIRRYIKE